MNLGHGYARITDIGETRIYAVKYLWKTVTIVVTSEYVKILGGGFRGKTQTFERGTRDYDARVSQLNALEEGFFKNERYWKKLVAAHRVWIKKGRPAWRNAGELKVYESYSPMTWE